MKKNRNTIRDNEDEIIEEKGHGFIIFICILSLIVIGGGSFAGFYFYKTNISSKNTQVEKTYVDIGEITVNLADESGKRYLKSGIYVGYDKGDKKAKKQLTKEKQLSVVQDALSFYLMQKKTDYFNGNYEDELKEELIDAVNKKVQDFKITDIKLVNLIIQ